MRDAVRQAAFSRRAATIFRDDFNRANGNLTDSPLWELGSGTAADLTITSTSRVATGITTANTSKALCPNLYSPNCYLQFEVRTTGNGRFRCPIRWFDADNHFYFRQGTNVLILGSIIATVQTDNHISVANTNLAGDILKVDCVNGVLNIYKNGSSLGAYTMSGAEALAVARGFRAGIGNATAAADPCIDNFEHGVLSV